MALLSACAPRAANAQGNASSAAGASSGSPAGASSAAGASDNAGAQSVGDVSTRLAKLGFHVFPKPVELPRATVAALNPSAKPLDLAALSGSVTLLNFWATWCPPCKREMPSIERLNALMKGTAFSIAAISTGEKPATVRSFIESKGYTFPVYLDEDGSFGGAYASQGIPTTYIVDKSGRIIAGIVGSREYDDPELVAVLKELAAR